MRISRLASAEGGHVLAVDSDGHGFRYCSTSFEALMAGALPELHGPAEGELLAPLRPGNVIGVGLNFRDTVEQMGWDMPERPYLFPKFASSVIGPNDAIVVDPSLTRRVDWEGEVAVVIGRTASRVAPARALNHVFGYLAANDVSARDLQESDGQWVRGKAMDTFCPLGPWIRTADEVPDPQDLWIRTWVDGELVQDGSTADMIFGVAELVAYISSFITLEPGDVLLTGTPAGCGDFRSPPRHLHPGSRVEVEVQYLGRLNNVVVRDPVVRIPA